MILAFHSIFSFYGFWLPNDPRGSRSDYVRSIDLLRHGTATKTNSVKSVAANSHDFEKRHRAKSSLAFSPVVLTGRQAKVVIDGFGEAIQQGGYLIHACSIMPDHVHLVIGRHERRIRQIVGHLKSSGTRALRNSDDWPDKARPIWGGHGWNVFLNSETAVRRAIRYVEENPVKQGLKRQNWPFVSMWRQ